MATTEDTTPSANRALLLTSHAEPLSLVSRPIQTPPPAGTAVVKILALPLLPYMRSILNHTFPYPLALPLVPGSAPTIVRVHALPADATTLKTGQLAIHSPYVIPRDDLEANNGILMGINGGGSKESFSFMEYWRDATMAEFAKVPLESLTTLNEDLLCGESGYGYDVTDLYHIGTLAIPFGGLCSADVKAGDTVIVAPATGRFGGAAVQAAIGMGARVVACGRSKDKLKRLEELFGARMKTVVLVDDSAKDSTAMKDAWGTGNGGADVYFDMSPSGSRSYVGAGLGALKRGGTAVLMGGVTGGLEVPYDLIMWMNLKIMGRFMYERTDMARLVRMVEGGVVELGKKVGIKPIGPFGLENIEEAMDSAEKDGGFGAQVVVVP